MFNRQVLLIMVSCSGWLSSAAHANDAIQAAKQDGSTCTPTHTISLDAPNLDWRSAEQHDRQRYGSATHQTLTSADINAMFQKPKNLEELLLNIKVAVDRDLLVQSEFYDNSVLERFFAASAISWETVSGYGVRKTGTLSFDDPTFAGIHGEVILGRAYQVSSDAHTEEYMRQGVIRLRLDKPEASMAVRSIVNTFGMPILAFKGCVQSGNGHGPDIEDPTCKGKIIYTYSKREFPQALLVANETEFKIRLGANERRSLTWDYRTPDGRQRFLCDEDELQDISVHQLFYPEAADSRGNRPR
jgi:hypothetical protein